MQNDSCEVWYLVCSDKKKMCTPLHTLHTLQGASPRSELSAHGQLLEACCPAKCRRRHHPKSTAAKKLQKSAMFFTCEKRRGFHCQLSPQLSDASEMVSSCSQLLAAGNDAKVRIYDSWLRSRAHLRSVAQSFETMLGV